MDHQTLSEEVGWYGKPTGLYRVSLYYRRELWDVVSLAELELTSS